MISPPPFLVPPVGLPPISSSYTLHSFTPPSLSSLWPPPSSFLSLSTRLVSLRFSPSVSIPLSCSPLVHVRVLIQPVAGLLTNPSFSFIFLTSCSLRRPRSASPSLPPFLPSPPHPSFRRVRPRATLKRLFSLRRLSSTAWAETYPWEQRRAPIIFFASGTEEKIRRQGER